jgi:hypothetical protein
VDENKRPWLPVHDEMGEDHRLPCTGGQAHDLAADPTQLGGGDRIQGDLLIGAEPQRRSTGCEDITRHSRLL